MRKIVACAFVSLDGVMQAPGGPDEDRSGGFQFGGWTAPYFNEVIGASVGETFATPFALLLGRKTYDIFAGHWPLVAKEPNASKFDPGELRIAKQFNEATKYVATHRPESLTWENTKALGKDVVASLRAIKKEDGPLLLTQGSSELLHTLLAEDLVDELKLLTFPVVLGRGKRFFPEGPMPSAFELVKSVTSPNGVVIGSYRRAGAVKTGSFQTPEK